MPVVWVVQKDIGHIINVKMFVYNLKNLANLKFINADRTKFTLQQDSLLGLISIGLKKNNVKQYFFTSIRLNHTGYHIYQG